MQGDIVFLGLTRPVMLFGVPFNFAVMEFIGTFILYMWFGWIFAVLGVLVFIFSYYMSTQDSYYLTILAVYYMNLFFRKDIIVTVKKKYYP